MEVTLNEVLTQLKKKEEEAQKDLDKIRNAIFEIEWEAKEVARNRKKKRRKKS